MHVHIHFSSTCKEIFMSSHNIISKILLVGIWFFLTFLLLARVVGLYKLF